MKSYHSLHGAFAVAVLAAASSSVQAATIANWKVISGSPSGNSGLDTDSPVFGSAASNNMANVTVAGRLGTTTTPESVTLAVGETMNVTATITLTGGTNNLTGDYRFGVFNDGGRFDIPSVTDWSGGWTYNLGTSAQAGLYKANTGTGGNMFSTSGTAPNNAALLATNTTPSGTFVGNSATSYTWTMSITRDTSATVDLVTSFIGGPSAFSQTMTVNDVTTSNFTYTAIAAFSTTNSQLDRLTVSSAQYSVVPEPSAALLGGLGFLVLLRRRRF